jgi:hypothetical protein
VRVDGRTATAAAGEGVRVDGRTATAAAAAAGVIGLDICAV